ncbi:MAG: hypothetical protein JNK64_03050 [Myxococcales bacterium]|nr:hypothetical protein [Myxococcales bacterium]
MRPLVVSLILGALAACGKDAAPPAPTAAPPPPVPTAVVPAAPAGDAAPPGVACAALPAPVTGHAIVELDLDGRGARERLVPTACDGDGTCAWAVFTGDAGCAQPLGTIAEADRIEALPITIDGVAAVRTLAVSPYYRTEAALAWRDGAWATMFTGGCAASLEADARWWCEARHDDRLASGAPAPALPCVVATAPTTALDVDRDGAAEALLPVACGDDLQSVCGTLVLATRGGCVRPLGFLPAGDVVLPPRPKRGAPPTIWVQRPDEAGTEEQIELTVRRDAGEPVGFEVLGVRTCDRDACGGWTAPDRGAER